MTGPKVVGSIRTDAPTPPVIPAEKTVSDKPTKVLPTDRVGFQKQFELLRGYAAITSQGKKIVTNPEVSDLVKIHPNTAIIAHPFFIDVGFLKKEGTGYVAAPEVLSYGKAISWNPDTAAHKLAPLLRQTWFANAIIPRLLMGTLTERQAIEVLADHSGAGPKYETQLKTILGYLVMVGLIRKEGDTYKQGIPAQEEVGVRSESNASRAEPEDEPRPVAPIREAGRGSALNTAFSHAPEGVLRFNVDVSVDMKEFATWKPERITAFWSGIAQVLAAKAAVEGETAR